MQNLKGKILLQALISSLQHSVINSKMISLIVLLMTSFLLAGTDAHFRPCLINYSDGSEKVLDCYPSNVFSCEQVNLTTAAQNMMNFPGNPNKPVDHEKATIVGLYLCKPRPCINPANLQENQTAINCANASASSQCVPAASSLPQESLVELQEEKKCLVSVGQFEDLSTDPDIDYRCSISPEVALAQLSCKVVSVEDRMVLSQRDCLKGARTCNKTPTCRVTVNAEEVDLFFCQGQ